MKFEIDKDQLLKAVTIVDSLISSRGVNAILSNCMFKIFTDELEVITTDNEIGIRTKADIKADSEFSFLANGRKFIALLKELPLGVVTISLNDSFVLDIHPVSGNIKGQYNLIGSSSKEYPEVPGFRENESVEIAQAELKDMIKKVVYAAATDTIKPVFNGVYFISDSGSSLNLVATDSRRLSVITRNTQNAVNLNEGVIIPLKAINELYRLLGTNGQCWLSFFENQCFFKIGKTEVVTRIVNGQYPNYKQVIPKEQHITAVAETGKLINSLRRALIFTREPVNKIVINFSENNMMIEVKTPELGECNEEIPIELNSKENISIGLNGQFLMEAVKEMDSNSVVFGITGQMNPVTITPDNDSGYTAVIMPIKIKSQGAE